MRFDQVPGGNIHANIQNTNPLTLNPSIGFKNYVPGNTFGLGDDDNSLHTELRQFRNREFFRDELAFSLGRAFPPAFVAGNIFNYTRQTSRRMPNTLWVDGTEFIGLNAHVQGAYLTLPEPEVGSHINVYTSNDDCEGPVQVGIRDGGIMSLGSNTLQTTANLILRGDGTEYFLRNGGTLNIRKGSELWVRAGTHLRLEGGTLNMQDSTRIVIEPGGTLSIQNSPVINLGGTNAQILMLGDFEMGAGSVFAPTGAGYVYFGSTNPNFFTATGPGCQIHFEGSGPHDIVLKVKSTSLGLPSEVSDFSIRHGKVQLGEDLKISSLSANTHFVIDDCSITPLQVAPLKYHAGIELISRPSNLLEIKHSTIQEGDWGIRYLGSTPDLNNLSIDDCFFFSNIQGIYSQQAGVDIHDSRFTGNLFGVNIEYPTNNCTLTQCVFTGNTFAVTSEGAPTGSPKVVIVEEGSSNTDQLPFIMESIHFKLRCFEVNNPAHVAITGNFRSTIDLYGGKSVFNLPNNFPDPVVYLNEAYDLKLLNGNNSFNNLTLSQKIFDGTFMPTSPYCSSSTLTSSQNWFAPNGTLQNRYFLTANCLSNATPPVPFMVPVTISESVSTASQNACNGGGGGPIDGGGGGNPNGRLTGGGSDGDFSTLFEIYPNPNNGRFTVSYTTDHAANVRIRIIDAIGKTVLETERSFSAGSNELDLDFSETASGIYLLQLFDGHTTYTTKVAKN